MKLFGVIAENPHFEWFDNPYIHAPFTIAFAGWLLWALIQWGWHRDEYRKRKESWWGEYKDEAVVSFIAMLMFLIWDTQMLYALDLAVDYFSGRDIVVPKEIAPEMYVAIAPVSERLYTFGGWINQKFKKKKNGEDS